MALIKLVFVITFRLSSRVSLLKVLSIINDLWNFWTLN